MESNMNGHTAFLFECGIEFKKVYEGVISPRKISGPGSVNISPKSSREATKKKGELSD